MNVLFIGNSYTSCNDVPGQVAALALADPGAPEVCVHRVVEGGATLKLHARETGARDVIAGDPWTHVVLQEKSTGPLHDRADFHRYAGELAAAASGARVLLYETWARKAGHEIYRWDWSGRSPARMLDTIRTELDAAARTLGAEIVPVGSAWARSLERHPQFVLHDTDDHHASPLGSHLAAAVFYAWLVGRDPTPVSCSIDGVERDAAIALRAVAWDVVSEQRG